MELNWKEDNNLVRKLAKILLGDTLPNGEPVNSLVLLDDASRAELQRWADMSDEEFEVARQSGDTIHIDVDDVIKQLEEKNDLNPQLFDDMFSGFDADNLDLWEEIRQREASDHDEPTEYFFSNLDPYFKPAPLPPDHHKHIFWFGEDGQIHVKNLSAYWIPELTVTEEIGGTIYTVTGSYEGTESFVRKLERITAKKFAEEVGDSK